MKLLKSCSGYFLAPLLSLLVFCLLFQIWKIDLTIPAFSYNNDGMFSIFIIKNIISSGNYACSDNIGWPHLVDRFCLYDFPMQSDMFQLIVIKFLAWFSDNPFLIANVFFIMTFMMISLSSFTALRQFKISVFSALLISILYAFVPYHFLRNVWHLFLSNYALIPLSIMVALWIATDKIAIFYVNSKGQYAIRANKFFFAAIAVAIVAAGNNIYYAYYSCIIWAFVWFLNGMRKGRFFTSGTAEMAILCGATFTTLIYLYLPTLLYQLKYGMNLYLAGRDVSSSEYFGLRIVDLFMPISNHYIKYLADTRLNFDELVSSNWERMSESLGFIASAGFLFLLVWLFGKGFDGENSLVNKTIKRFSIKKDEQLLISYLAKINIFIVLFATISGLVMFIVISFPTLRSHARAAIFVSFVSFFLVAIIFDKVIERKILGKKIYAQIVLLIFTIFGVFDQVGKVSAATAQTDWIKKKYYSDQKFINDLESSLPAKAQIFILPNYGFPEFGADDYRSVIAYAHSKNLNWSYPVVTGREAFFWQNKVVNLPWNQFVAEIKKVGFIGVYVDRDEYRGDHGTIKLMQLEKFLKSLTKETPIVSPNKSLVFYHI